MAIEYEEGMFCLEPGCVGELYFPPVEGCTCFKSAPCGTCTSQKLECNICHTVHDQDAEDEFQHERTASDVMDITRSFCQ